MSTSNSIVAQETTTATATTTTVTDTVTTVTYTSEPYYPVDPSQYVSRQTPLQVGDTSTLTILQADFSTPDNSTDSMGEFPQKNDVYIFKVVELPDTDGNGLVEYTHKAADGTIISQETESTSWYFFGSVFIYTDWDGWKNFLTTFNDFMQSMMSQDTTSPGSSYDISITYEETANSFTMKIVSNYTSQYEATHDEPSYYTVSYSNAIVVYDKTTGALVKIDNEVKDYSSSYEYYYHLVAENPDFDFSKSGTTDTNSTSFDLGSLPSFTYLGFIVSGSVLAVISRRIKH